MFEQFANGFDFTITVAYQTADLSNSENSKIVKKNTFVLFFPICRGSVANCGSAVKWLQSLGIIQNPRESGDLASKVEDTGEVYFVPA